MRDIASIIGLKVISIQEGREVGEVSQVIVDLSSGAIEGMIIGSGAAEKGLAADDIQIIGTDAVMIATHRLARPLSELPQLLEKRREVDAAPRVVITDTGKRLGTLGTIYIDAAARCVTRYEISGGAWRDMTDGVLSMAPVEGTVDGRDSLVIPAALLVSLGASSGGLKSKIGKLGESAKQQGKQAAESLSEGAANVKRGVANVAEKATQVGGKLREEAVEATTKVKEEAGELGAKIKEGAAKAGEAVQNLGEKVKEEASEAGEKLREGTTAIGAHFHREAPDAQKMEEGEKADATDAAEATEPASEQTCSCCCEAPVEECVCTPEECAECESDPCACEPCCECGVVICEVCGADPCTCAPDCECGVAACDVCGCDPCECTPCGCTPCAETPATEDVQKNEDGPEKSE